MKVVLVGGGGREAALAWRIAKSPTLTRLFVVNENPGWPEGTVSAPGDPVEVAKREGADLVVVGPEGPLADGLADRLAAAGVPCFGPVAAAARLESSKAFAKEILAAAGVPTAEALVVRGDEPADRERALARAARGAVVIKVDGLAAGKGVFVCPDAAQARDALEAAWSGRFGAAADRLVLEDLLTGPEVSLFGLTDGQRVVSLPVAQDHKRLQDDDEGPNTGGMGAYAPCPLLPPEEAERLVQAIHAPVIAELARRGIPYRGVLFAGLMLTPSGPRVLEFNVRFGDPECQPLMCLWEDDVLPWLHGAASGALPPSRPHFAPGAACCVVLASAGYPDTASDGVLIPEPGPLSGVEVFLAGARRADDGALVTRGGRVLGITGVAGNLAEARESAYEALPRWLFHGAQWRSDVGLGGLR